MIASPNREGLQMFKISGTVLLCVASTAAMASAPTPPETFVIQTGQSGRAATIKVPVGAVSAFSATVAEALVGFADPKVEAMRLSGDVLINVVGTAQPIQIKADNVVLELTADDAPAAKKSGFLPALPAPQLRSTEVIIGGDDTQTFVGNVVFTVQTSFGAMEIRADRVLRRKGPPEGA